MPVADGTRRALLITSLGRFLAFWALPQDAEVRPHSSPGHAPGHARLPHGAQLDPQRDGKSHTRELSVDKNQEVIQNWCPSALGNRKTEQLRDNDDLSENKPCVPRVERPRPADDTARGSGSFRHHPTTIRRWRRAGQSLQCCWVVSLGVLGCSLMPKSIHPLLPRHHMCGTRRCVCSKPGRGGRARTAKLLRHSSVLSMLPALSPQNARISAGQKPSRPRRTMNVHASVVPSPRLPLRGRLQQRLIPGSPTRQKLLQHTLNANGSPYPHPGLCLVRVDEFKRRLPRVKRSELYTAAFAVAL